MDCGSEAGGDERNIVKGYALDSLIPFKKSNWIVEFLKIILCVFLDCAF